MLPGLSVIQHHLFQAVLRGNVNRANDLISRGADVNAIGGDHYTIENGQTLLYIATHQSDVAMVRLLLKHNANVNQKIKDGSTPLFAVCQQGNELIFQMLLDHGALTTIKDNDGESPIFVAAGYGHDKLVQILISKGAKATEVNTRGASLLFIACQKGHLKIAELLFLSNPELINQARTSDNTTPLHVAAYAGKHEIVNFLLAHGADTTVKNMEGKTAYDYAKQNGFKDIMASLIGYKSKFIYDVRDLLEMAKLISIGSSHELQWIERLCVATTHNEDADQVFNNIRLLLKDTSDPNYLSIKDSVLYLRKEIIKCMEQYNRAKRYSEPKAVFDKPSPKENEGTSEAARASSSISLGTAATFASMPGSSSPSLFTTVREEKVTETTNGSVLEAAVKRH